MVGALGYSLPFVVLATLGAPGQIQISAATQQALRDDFICERRGDLDVKGKGIQETWFLIDRNQPHPGTANLS